MSPTDPSLDNPTIHFVPDRQPTGAALERIRFDIESILQVVGSLREPRPEVWVARPDGYESEGHVLRDSEAIRLAAYSPLNHVVYATDGCNSCRHRLEVPLDGASLPSLDRISSDTQLPVSLLEALSRLLSETGPQA